MSLVSRWLQGPTPPYNNPIPQPQFYHPFNFVITAIVLGQTTIVTMNINTNFKIGQLVRLIIPNYCGCTQLNEKTGIVISIPADNQVQITIDSSYNVDAFIVPAVTKTQAQINPVGDYNNGVTSRTPQHQKTFIPGSFINVSPRE